MREILFKGKRADNGEWVEGDLYRRTDRFGEHETIIFEDKGPDCFKKNFVDPETVCQYIGLEDKNGKKIFEGDIVKEQDDKCIGVVRYGTYDSPFNSDGLGGHMGFYIEWEEGRIKLRRRDIVFWSDVIDVIGNIFDNPELLTED